MAGPKRTCSFDGCEKPHESYGLCGAHRRQMKFKGVLIPLRPRMPRSELSDHCTFPECKKPRASNNLCKGHDAQRSRAQVMRPLREFISVCALEGCERPHKAHGYCGLHWRQKRSGQEFTLRPKRRALQKGEWFTTAAGYKGRHAMINGAHSIEYEHRRVMEQALGRLLVTGENVHHINGDRADNRPENLELWVTRQPAGQRVADKVTWAKEILALYEPGALR